VQAVDFLEVVADCLVRVVDSLEVVAGSLEKEFDLVWSVFEKRHKVLGISVNYVTHL
jgi:hypothetical protein